MRVLQARSRASGPDTYALDIFPDNDPTFYFNVRIGELDGSLIPLKTDNGHAEFVIINQRDNARRTVEGVEVAEGIWRFDLRSNDVSIAHNWRVDSLINDRRTTHALGNFVYGR